MAQTLSTMLPLGTPAPDFSLPEPATGELIGLADFRGKPLLVVAFISNHCPFVKHIREGFVKFVTDYRTKGLACVAICANDVANYPDDSPARMAEDARAFGYPFPYLYDETQQTAKAYRAACTPDFFLFNAERKLAPVTATALPGRLPSNCPRYTSLRSAADALLSGWPVSPEQRPSVGCNIKWKSGNEPDYFA